MARFSMQQGVQMAKTGGSNNKTGYFSLKNDGDIAKVRFLYDSADDVEGFMVHQVEINGKKRWVNCLRENGDGVDVCPFCAAGIQASAKFFIPLYNLDSKCGQIWERGVQFGSKLSSLCGRYPDLSAHTFEIERNGRPGDTNTTYEIYETGSDDCKVDDFDEVKILGGLVLDKTADEMDEFLHTGEFGTIQQPQRRQQSRQEEAPRRRSEEPRRRTPVNDEDDF